MKKQIMNYPNYFIYDNGDVVNSITGKLLDGSISEGGYKYYRLSKDGIKHMFYCHRLVAEHFLNNPNNLPVVNHKDGNKLNNDVSNLEWVSYSDNILHAHQTGLIHTRRKTEFYDSDLEGERWKIIPNFSSYSISSCGRVRNDLRNTILHPSLSGGYFKVRLSNNGVVQDFFIYRLVYMVFNNMSTIPNGMMIDHIDCNKQNDSLDNLRLITYSENVLACFYEQKHNSSIRPVAQYTLQGEYIASFPSCREAGRKLNLDSSTISKVCRGKNKSHGGFVFKFLDS